jgi:hypothetical protein
MEIDNKLFYFVGMVCFSIVILMNILFLSFNYLEIHIFNIISSLAMNIFYIFLVLIFYKMYNQEKVLSGDLTGVDLVTYNDYVASINRENTTKKGK